MQIITRPTQVLVLGLGLVACLRAQPLSRNPGLSPRDSDGHIAADIISRSDDDEPQKGQDPTGGNGKESFYLGMSLGIGIPAILLSSFLVYVVVTRYRRKQREAEQSQSQSPSQSQVKEVELDDGGEDGLAGDERVNEATASPDARRG